MSDPYVVNVQNWLNATYTGVSGWNPVVVDGKTGWKTIYALLRALQHELGITALADNFGDGTMAALTSHGNITENETNPNILNILVGAMYCKGYEGGNGTLDGTWQTKTTGAVNKLQSDIGINVTGVVVPKLFKALLTMDAYIRVGEGTEPVREVQQWMNGKYLNSSWFSIIPCDGSYSRDVQKMLVYAIQTELNVSGANGNFGVGTRAALKAKPPVSAIQVDTGSSVWVRLFQAAMRFNKFVCNFNGTFSYKDRARVTNFQYFTGLPQTGKGDYQTWCSLIVSNGDPERTGQACDCVTTITPNRAQALVASGRTIVGRYITGTVKNIQPGELSTILTNGMTVFPIYQTSATTASYFTPNQGASDANDAQVKMRDYGFGRDTVIYYAVDFDPTGEQIDNAIIPYFQAINQQDSFWSQVDGLNYQIGVYGTRNVCNKLRDAGLAVNSFVAGMSSGYSGNLGFQLPVNWAFDQIATLTVGSGSGSIEIDNDIASGRDLGQRYITKLDTSGSGPYYQQDPHEIGLDVGAKTVTFHTSETPNVPGLQVGDPMILSVPDQGDGGDYPCTVAVRYNKGYCWFLYNGGNADHSSPWVKLLVGNTTILDSEDQPNNHPVNEMSANALWSTCSSVCGGSLVRLEYRQPGPGSAWVTSGTFIAT